MGRVLSVCHGVSVRSSSIGTERVKTDERYLDCHPHQVSRLCGCVSEYHIDGEGEGLVRDISTGPHEITMSHHLMLFLGLVTHHFFHPVIVLRPRITALYMQVNSFCLCVQCC